MFVRKWSSLPAETIFPSDLKGLGYFINKDDEIRSIENEDHYFKYFINRNVRINDRQRFAMNQAIQEEVFKRFTALNLSKHHLPLSATPHPETTPVVPIFATANLASKSRVILIFGETHQDLGILAHRVAGGPGGIATGTLISAIKTIQTQHTTYTNRSPPGIILANMGELIWYPAGNRTLSKSAFDAAPMRSAAHAGNYIDPVRNRVAQNGDYEAHVRYVMEEVVGQLVSNKAGLDIIGLGDGANAVMKYLNDDAVWDKVGRRLNCFASVGGQFPSWEVVCEPLREFLLDRARAYVPSDEPAGMVLAGPAGNPATTTFTDFGCPVFSSGEPFYVECLFIRCHAVVLRWMQKVADTDAVGPSKRIYRNPVFTVVYGDLPADDNDWTEWEEELGAVEGGGGAVDVDEGKETDGVIGGGGGGGDDGVDAYVEVDEGSHLENKKIDI